MRSAEDGSVVSSFIEDGQMELKLHDYYENTSQRDYIGVMQSFSMNVSKCSAGSERDRGGELLLSI